MPSRDGPVHVATTTRKYKDKVYTTHLLRRSYREDGKVKNETVGNLSHLPDHVVELIRAALKGNVHTPAADGIEAISSFHHGHAQAVLTAMDKLGFDNLLASRPSRERSLVMGMVASRILQADSKLATTRWWQVTTLPQDLGISDATEDDLYAALDWLLDHQDGIEKKLAKRHLAKEGLVLYDLSSTYVEGTSCPLAALGHNRDGKKGKLQINFGMLADSRGCPVAVTVYPGNTGDSTTLLDQLTILQDMYGIERVALVGDRGMISQRQIDAIKDMPGVDWITALKTPQIRKLLEQGYVQLGLFDERNLFEFTHPDFPGERLVACRNPELAKLRAHKRQDLLTATVLELETVQRMAGKGRLKGQDAIGVRVGKVINKFKVGKHFEYEIQDDTFIFRIAEDRVAKEAALDGIYIVRTSFSKEALGTDDTVRGYKSLANVERAFRSMKTIDLHVRPIYHHLEDRVRAHIFLCMLAYYVEWHMREAWREVTFGDEDQKAKKTRDPVAPAVRSEKALAKVHNHQLEDGTEANSFRTLLANLGGIVRNVCRRKGASDKEPTFTITTIPSPLQRRALDLVGAIAVGQ